MTTAHATVQEAQALLGSGRPQQAQTALQQLLQDEPDHVEARYALAVAQRHQHQWPMALATLRGLLRERPHFGRAHQEIGYNHIAMRRFAAASAAFEQAVAQDPSLINSWKCLAKLYEEQRPRLEESTKKLANAREQIAFLGSLPAELLTVISYLSEDRLADAERLCKHFLRGNRTHVEGMRLLAEIATRNKVFDEAEFLLESCIEFEPDHRNARIQYVNVLLRMQLFAKAQQQAKQLLAEHPDDANVIRALYAAACAGVGRSQEAIVHYQRLMDAHPSNVAYPISLAHIHKSNGNIDEAVRLYRLAYHKKRDHGDAYWSLANTKSYQFTDDEIARMTAAEAASTTAENDRIQLRFALGNAFESRGEYQRAFMYYDAGNSLKHATAYHSPEHLQVRVDSQIEVCTEALFKQRSGVGIEAADPIFIVGLPRAGSTLLEQILASHSQVDGTMELHNILNLAKRLRGRSDDARSLQSPQSPQSPRYPRILAELDADYFRRFGEQFIEDTRAYRGDAPFFIDKMPNNFFHIGLIRLILPNAKIIDARREPMACCFSGFKQLFGEGQEFSYSLATIGNYYRQYVALMDHWDRVLPGFVLRVQHEDVVADLAGQVRRLLDFCDLPFEQACVDYHRTERSVYTPSAEQVRRPIYREGLDQWRHFEPWLTPLKEALGADLLARDLVR